LYLKIISIVDGSFHSELAARHAVAIASSCGSELVVLAVDTGEVDQDKLFSAVERVSRYAKNQGVKARGFLRSGEPVKTILATVYAENADLLVTATHQSDYRLFVRSTPQQLMVKAPCSTLAIKPAGIVKKGKSMLLPVAHRETATEERIMLALSLAKFYSYRVEILHVIERRHWYNLPWDRLYTMRHHGEENMMPIANALKEKGIGVNVRAVIAENSISAIQKEVALGKHSLVLVGASKKGILKQIISGNPIEQMLSSILCDVLVWRPKL